jgi:hypothetical protein
VECAVTTEAAISNRRRWGIVALLFLASMINYLVGELKLQAQA